MGTSLTTSSAKCCTYEEHLGCLDKCCRQVFQNLLFLSLCAVFKIISFLDVFDNWKFVLLFLVIDSRDTKKDIRTYVVAWCRKIDDKVLREQIIFADTEPCAIIFLNVVRGKCWIRVNEDVGVWCSRITNITTTLKEWKDCSYLWVDSWNLAFVVFCIDGCTICLIIDYEQWDVFNDRIAIVSFYAMLGKEAKDVAENGSVLLANHNCRVGWGQNSANICLLWTKITF